MSISSSVTGRRRRCGEPLGGKAGEVGGEQEEKAAGFISRRMTKPVAVYIAGRYSPPGKRMGHAGAIVRGAAGTVAGKQEALAQAGAAILETPADVLAWVKKHKLG